MKTPVNILLALVAMFIACNAAFSAPSAVPTITIQPSCPTPAAMPTGTFYSGVPCGLDAQGKVIPCPETCKTVIIVCDENTSEIPLMYVSYKGNGLCELHISKNSFMGAILSASSGASNGPGQFADVECGRSVAVNRIWEFIDFARNQFGMSLDKIIAGGLRENPDKNTTLRMTLAAMLEQCGLSDELYHMLDKFKCCAHKSCVEYGSGLANLNCVKSPITEDVLKKLLAQADNRQELESVFCRHEASVAARTQVEKCICETSRTNNRQVTSDQCQNCVNKWCNVDNSQLSPRCKTVLYPDPPNASTDSVRTDIQNACRSDYLSNGRHSHSCESYTQTVGQAEIRQ